jgi:hypothetical protein
MLDERTSSDDTGCEVTIASHASNSLSTDGTVRCVGRRTAVR